MHEYSIVQALITQCEEIAKQNSATKVTKVVVKIGVLSGVEVHLLETAFNTFKEDTICDGAEFVLNLQKVVLECKDCGNSYEVDELEYKCTKCQSSSVKIIDGEEMLLMSLEME